MRVYFEPPAARRECEANVKRMWSEVKVAQTFTLEVNRTNENEEDTLKEI